MPDNLHIGDGLIFDRHMHVDGVFAHRPVLAVDRVGTVGVVAGVLLVGCSAVRIVGMVFVVRIRRIAGVGGATAVLRIFFLRLHAFAGISGIFIVHRCRRGFAARRQQRKACRRQCDHFDRIR